MSDSDTKMWSTKQPPPFKGNTAGECYDCYFGTVPRISTLAKQVDTDRKVMNIGVFPMDRYKSMCERLNNEEFDLLKIAGSTLAQVSKVNWAYGTMKGKGLPLFLHTNCITIYDWLFKKMPGDLKKLNHEHYKFYSHKEIVLKYLNSWFLDDNV